MTGERDYEGAWHELGVFIHEAEMKLWRASGKTFDRGMARGIAEIRAKKVEIAQARGLPPTSKELAQPKLPLSAKAGQRYVRRDGTITAPLENVDRAGRVLTCPLSGDMFEFDGRAIGGKRDGDLVSEVKA